MKQAKYLASIGSIVTLSGGLALGVASCGGDQSEAQYPENSYSEEPAEDPFDMPEGSEEMEEAPEMEMEGAPDGMDAEQGPGAMQGGPGPAPAGAANPSPPKAVSSQEIDAFSNCVVKLTNLQKGLEQRAQQGEPPEQLNEEFQKRAAGILNGEGLSPKRYEEIAQLVTQDPQLRERIQEAIEAEVKS